MLDTPGIAHAARRDDDGAVPDGIELHGFFDILDEVNARFFTVVITHPLNRVERFLVEQGDMFHGDIGSRQSHWRIHINIHVAEPACAIEINQQEQ